MSATRDNYRSIEPTELRSEVQPNPRSSTPESRLLDVREAAQFLAITVSTLYGWVWQRKISFVKLGRALRFDIADLRRFVDQNRVPPRRTSRP
jgi:excisionase family DNA binding protein